MEKEVLQITFTTRKAPKTKFGRWLYWKVWFQFWHIWRPRQLSKFYGALSTLFLSFLPKEKREEILKEFDEIEIQFIDKTEE